MKEEKWRFPAANHGQLKGISTGDAEVFRRAPYQAFAREVLQNSIDARDSDEEPVRVEFSSFEIEKSKIPGYSQLVGQIRRCREYWVNKEDYQKAYDRILTHLERDKIRCLRVSDYNTTGLIGVDSNVLKENKFLALAKGTGLSEKTGSVSGGSKGVGKNAAFLLSNTKTVFYSTNANQDAAGRCSSVCGYIGVSELISGWIDDEHKTRDDDFTQGTGYFASDDLNNAIGGVLDLDSNYHERKEKSGTDIYIVSFEPEDNWKEEIVCSILDSFMAAIVRKEMSVYVDGIEINSNSIEDLVYNENLIPDKMKSGLISQYILLTDSNIVKTYDVETEYGHCDLYILPLKKSDKCQPTHKCVMIRHPLMKIKDISLSQSLPVSAMCIIDNGQIGKMLRRIENPQHLDWEPNRCETSDEKREYKALLSEIVRQIKEKVIDCLKIEDEQEIDPNGAGDYLPEKAEEMSSGESSYEKPQEKVTVSPPKENTIIEKNANIIQEDGNGLEPNVGEKEDGNKEEVMFPKGRNKGKDGDVRPGSNTGNEKEGDDVIFKKARLAGVRYKVISTNRSLGRLKIVFIAPISYKSCYLSIYMLDDNNASTPVGITELVNNGVNVECDDPNEYGPFEIIENQKIVLEVSTNTKGYFGSEVKIICK